jgi:Zn-finger nucleic acid-binding protein
MGWAQRLKRVFGIEIDTCQRCGGTLRIVASIEQPEVIAMILAHRERTAPQPKQPERRADGVSWWPAWAGAGRAGRSVRLDT